MNQEQLKEVAQALESLAIDWDMFEDLEDYLNNSLYEDCYKKEYVKCIKIIGDFVKTYL